ncbi:Alpha/Beta hydrolase protein [Mycena galericulata]|nr:Alpha/Beta hydrolase protein [Mycena galericulata]
MAEMCLRHPRGGRWVLPEDRMRGKHRSLILLYVLASRPIPSNRLPAPTDPGLASLPLNSRPREVYAEDWAEGGAYVELPMGRVRYWLVGPKTGKKITLIHGLSIPSLAFARLVPILVAAGYYVMVYDLYGRGYSDAPRGVPYDTTLYVTQLALLLQHLRWERTRLVGFSMGGAIVAAFVATFPALVERDVVFIASAGVSEAPIPLTQFRHLPFVQWLVMRRIVRPMPVPTKSEADEHALEEIVRLQATHLPGYARAVVSSVHNGPITRMRWAFTAPGAWKGRRALIIHGTHDPVVPPTSAPILLALISSHADADGTRTGADASLVRVQDAGHDVPWTHPEEVGHAVVTFLEAEE